MCVLSEMFKPMKKGVYGFVGSDGGDYRTFDDGTPPMECVFGESVITYFADAIDAPNGVIINFYPDGNSFGGGWTRTVTSDEAPKVANELADVLSECRSFSDMGRMIIHLDQNGFINAY